MNSISNTKESLSKVKSTMSGESEEKKDEGKSMKNMTLNPKKPRSIEVLREYQTYSFQNACTHTVEHKLMVFVPEELNYFFVPFFDFLPNLDISLQDGIISPIISYKDFHKVISRPSDKPFTIDEIRKEAAKIYGVSEKLMKKYKSFAIVLFPEHKDHFNEIIVKWTEPKETSKNSSDLLTLFSEFKVSAIASKDASLYVSFNVDEKYEIEDSPRLSKFVDGEIGIENKETTRNREDLESSEHVIMSNKKQHVLHFEKEFSNEIEIEYKIRVPRLYLIWIWAGLLFGVGCFVYVLFAAPNFISAIPVSFATIGALIGFRAMLFHDLDLLGRWTVVYLVLVIANIVALAYLGIKLID